MSTPEPIETSRLVLRPLSAADADDVTRLASRFEIADMTLSVPHPYARSDAEGWLAKLPGLYAAGSAFPMAMTVRGTGELVGVVGLEMHLPHQRAELGYWVGVPHWGKGYATEASAAMLAMGFERLRLNKIVAHHFARNPASGRVLEKIGMRREGVFRRHTRKWEGYEDIVAYGILSEQCAAS